jgi:hypothetical protein
VGPALSPVVHGTRAFLRSIVWVHILGQVVGGLCLGVAAVGVGVATHLLGTPGTIAVAVSVVLYATSEVLRWTPWRPSRDWQVPEHYRRTPYVRAMAVLWGFALGAGWLTRTTTPFVIAFLGMAVGPPPLALIAGAAFGLTRGMTVLLGIGGRDFNLVVQRYAEIAHRLQALPAVTTVLGLALATVIAVN